MSISFPHLGAISFCRHAELKCWQVSVIISDGAAIGALLLVAAACLCVTLV